MRSDCRFRTRSDPPAHFHATQAHFPMVHGWSEWSDTSSQRPSRVENHHMLRPALGSETCRQRRKFDKTMSSKVTLDLQGRMPCTTVNAVHVCYDGEFSRFKSVQRAPFDRIPPDPVRIAVDGKHEHGSNGPGSRQDKIGRIKSRSIGKYRVGESHLWLERPDEIVGRSQNFFSSRKFWWSQTSTEIPSRHWGTVRF